ncbi:phosphotransferase [Cellulomonas hominis]|nr:phosphotransferase [Cellulomonas hominis]
MIGCVPHQDTQDPQDTQTPDAEERLPGGNTGGAVRVGDSVRRPAGPWTPAVQLLLAHLRARGVTEVPEPRGVDDRGRDVTAFVPGTVPAYPMPAWVWADHVIAEAAALLRRVHDASADLDTAGLVWRLPAREPAEVVCHSDAAPYNLVFTDGHVVGLIDWDTAAPGPRVWDLAYLAYRLAPLGPAAADPEDVPLVERARRLALLCAAYGRGVRERDVLVAVPGRLRALADHTRARAAGSPELRAHADAYTADAAWVEGATEALLAAP